MFLALLGNLFLNFMKFFDRYVVNLRKFNVKFRLSGIKDESILGYFQDKDMMKNRTNRVWPMIKETNELAS